MHIAAHVMDAAVGSGHCGHHVYAMDSDSNASPTKIAFSTAYKQERPTPPKPPPTTSTPACTMHTPSARICAW